MSNLKTSIDKDEFLAKPLEEQNYLIFGAVGGHEERITTLEKQKWVKSSLAFVGGVFGGIVAKIGLG